LQVADASKHVAAVSQFLAEGANTQASSIQEASSSMEEILSVTRQTAENAKHADNFMKEVSAEAGHAKQSMSELIVFMEEISKTSDETSKIVGAIDGIAFQTNLLALNASIEAARAGDAGAGFSIVADEVRRLARHSKDAAKNTSEMVGVIIRKVREGVSRVRKTDEIFIRVSESASKGSDLVSGIAASSREQSQNIDQAGRAIAEVANLVHKTAANAEESSAVSEEMASQAEQMKTNLNVISAIVGSQMKESYKGDRR
jgi:methyl-accepting chemotaxis protein